jgi:hypothetical protein
VEEGERLVGTDVRSGRRARDWVRRGKEFGCAVLDGRLVAIHDWSDRSAPLSTAGSESQVLGAKLGVANSDHPETPAIVVVTALSTTTLRRLRDAQQLLSVVAFSEVVGGE